MTHAELVFIAGRCIVLSNILIYVLVLLSIITLGIIIISIVNYVDDKTWNIKPCLFLIVFFTIVWLLLLAIFTIIPNNYDEALIVLPKMINFIRSTL